MGIQLGSEGSGGFLREVDGIREGGTQPLDRGKNQMYKNYYQGSRIKMYLGIMHNDSKISSRVKVVGIYWSEQNKKNKNKKNSR